MSVSNNTINKLKESKKSIVFSQNSSTSGSLFKYLCGNTMVYKNYTLENNGKTSQIYQNDSNMNIQTPQVNFMGNFIRSRGLTGDQGYTVGDTISKDMGTTNCDSLTASRAPFGIAISNNQATASYWEDWGDDIFDDWGFFYIFDIATKQYYFPILSPENLADGTFTTQTFNAFGRNYTITHGYPAQGIFKFDVSCSDDSEFIFGAYGNMGSDEDTINTNFTQSYTLNNKSFTLYYNRNIEDGDATERFFSYFIPYEPKLNNTKTYSDFLGNDDELSLFSIPVRYGLTVYFSKKNDIKNWVINDLHIPTQILVQGNVLVNGNCLSRCNLVSMPDSDYNAKPQELINGYFRPDTNLNDNRLFILPNAVDIIGAINNYQVGTSFQFTINNVQGANFTRNLTTSDSSVIILNSMTVNVPQNSITRYNVIITNITPGFEQVLIFEDCYQNIIL